MLLNFLLCIDTVYSFSETTTAKRGKFFVFHYYDALAQRRDWFLIQFFCRPDRNPCESLRSHGRGSDCLEALSQLCHPPHDRVSIMNFIMVGLFLSLILKLEISQ